VVKFLQIDVSVNAPQAGKVVELLVDEESTVTVGQDLFRIEPGAESEGARMLLGALNDYI
jgi:2-oxoglutarate dehydrogenase E2 component (dihydrolipoamide succinyltransferase)